MLRDFYSKVEGDYDAALTAFKDEKRILRFVSRFPDDPSYDQLTQALARGDLHGAFQAAHTLKGVAMTLRMTALYEAARDVTEALRAGNEALAHEKMPRLEKYYRLTESSLKALN